MLIIELIRKVADSTKNDSLAAKLRRKRFLIFKILLTLSRSVPKKVLRDKERYREGVFNVFHQTVYDWKHVGKLKSMKID